MTNTHTLIGGFVAVLFIAIALVMLSPRQDAEAAIYGATTLSSATTSTAYSVTSTANVRVLATTTSTTGTSYTRVYASICNPSATVVYLNMNRDNPVTASSSLVQIAAAAGYSSCYEITDKNLYQGSVQASSTVGTVTVFVTDFVQ